MQNKFYILRNDVDPKVIGKNFTQIYMRPDIQNFSSWRFPDKSLSFQAELEDKSIVTDFLNTAAATPTGFFISERTRHLLEQFSLMQHHFYSVEVEKDNEVFQYYWLHLCDLKLVDHLDYGQSTFFETRFNSRVNSIELDSLQNYQKLKDEKDFSFGVEIENIVFQPSYPGYEMLTLLPFAPRVFISQRLRDELIEAGITGFTCAEEKIISTT